MLEKFRHFYKNKNFKWKRINLKIKASDMIS